MAQLRKSSLKYIRNSIWLKNSEQPTYREEKKIILFKFGMTEGC